MNWILKWRRAVVQPVEYAEISKQLVHRQLIKMVQMGREFWFILQLMVSPVWYFFQPSHMAAIYFLTNFPIKYSSKQILHYVKTTTTNKTHHWLPNSYKNYTYFMKHPTVGYQHLTRYNNLNQYKIDSTIFTIDNCPFTTLPELKWHYLQHLLVVLCFNGLIPDTGTDYSP